MIRESGPALGKYNRRPPKSFTQESYMTEFKVFKRSLGLMKAGEGAKMGRGAGSPLQKFCRSWQLLKRNGAVDMGEAYTFEIREITVCERACLQIHERIIKAINI